MALRTSVRTARASLGFDAMYWATDVGRVFATCLLPGRVPEDRLNRTRGIIVPADPGASRARTMLGTYGVGCHGTAVKAESKIKRSGCNRTRSTSREEVTRSCTDVRAGVRGRHRRPAAWWWPWRLRRGGDRDRIAAGGRAARGGRPLQGAIGARVQFSRPRCLSPGRPL